MEVNDIRYDENFAVVQANKLLRSKQEELTLLEVKLIRLIISQVLKDDNDFRTYRCNITDLAEYLGITADNIYKVADDTTTRLMKKLIRIPKPGKRGKENYEKFHWVDYANYTDGVIVIRLSSDLKPYLLGLDALFTRYSYEAIMELPTGNSIRLYELLASYQNITVRSDSQNTPTIPCSKNEIPFDITWLRGFFNCENKYPNTADFIKRIIEPSVTAIKNQTLMRVSYRTVKSGRSITHIVFKLHSWTDSTYSKET